MQDELEDNQEEYFSLNYEGWCDLLSTIEVKYYRKTAATQIKQIASSRATSHSDSDGSVKTLGKKKARTGVIRNKKGTPIFF